MADSTHKKVYRYNGLTPTHQAVLDFVKPGSRVLEFGCAAGNMTKGFVEQLGCSVTAIEINAEEAEGARPFAEQLIVGDIEDPAVWEQMKGPYDAAVFADVLEHLADPWKALRRTRELLTKDAVISTSIPNVAYYKIRKQLLLGRFNYTQYGILDSTHLRFFTEQSARAMLSESGFDVSHCVRMFRAKTDRRLWRLCPSAFTFNFIIAGTPTQER